MTELAAIDLGSNSFHMIIAKLEDGELRVVDRIKEMVRLAAGLDDNAMLAGDPVRKAIETLTRFKERLRPLDPKNIRAVGTNTMRTAKNARDFMIRAEDALGHQIDIVSGDEEARLIYLGVAHSVERNDDPRLVVDIGGGSTEIIVGEQFNPWLRESKYMGCVSWSRRFFPDGLITPERFERATRAARQEMLPSRKQFLNSGFHAAIGASGTIKAVQNIVQMNAWATDFITRDSMDALRDALFEHGDINTIELLGLEPDRQPVFMGGFAILYAVFESLQLNEMTTSEGAMREGILYDLLDRTENRDVREETIAAIMTRYNVDVGQAKAVEDTAISLWNQAKKSWGLDEKIFEQLLRWSSRIHEIGLSIAHSGYHKHGSYLVENSDMPGFSRQDQSALWAMLRSHRRKFKPHRFETFDTAAPALIRATALLRLAALLNRNRDGAPDATIQTKDAEIVLTVPNGYFTDNPLTRDDLETERSYLENVGLKLEFNDR